MSSTLCEVTRWCAMATWLVAKCSRRVFCSASSGEILISSCWSFVRTSLLSLSAPFDGCDFRYSDSDFNALLTDLDSAKFKLGQLKLAACCAINCPFCQLKKSDYNDLCYRCKSALIVALLTNDTNQSRAC